MPERGGKDPAKGVEKGGKTRENPASDWGDALCFVGLWLGSFAENVFLVGRRGGVGGLWGWNIRCDHSCSPRFQWSMGFEQDWVELAASY